MMAIQVFREGERPRDKQQKATSSVAKVPVCLNACQGRKAQALKNQSLPSSGGRDDYALHWVSIHVRGREREGDVGQVCVCMQGGL